MIVLKSKYYNIVKYTFYSLNKPLPNFSVLILLPFSQIDLLLIESMAKKIPAWAPGYTFWRNMFMMPLLSDSKW